MSREFKFRARRLIGGKWVYGHYYFNGVAHWIVNNDKFSNDHHEVNPETVGQFTGLYDKNKKEIYEDDIVKYSYISPLDSKEKSYIWVVEYENGMYWLRHIGGLRHYDSSLFLKFNRIDVIGNKWIIQNFWR